MRLAIVFVKDTATDAAVKTNLGIIGENTVVLSLQNGIGNEEVLARFVPAIGFCSARPSITQSLRALAKFITADRAQPTSARLSVTALRRTKS
ncbi:MAG: ketopantoate reductase family protein [Christensenellales bacterium]